jgi:hypothetical protein
MSTIAGRQPNHALNRDAAKHALRCCVLRGARQLHVSEHAGVPVKQQNEKSISKLK